MKKILLGLMGMLCISQAFSQSDILSLKYTRSNGSYRIGSIEITKVDVDSVSMIMLATKRGPIHWGERLPTANTSTIHLPNSLKYDTEGTLVVIPYLRGVPSGPSKTVAIYYERKQHKVDWDVLPADSKDDNLRFTLSVSDTDALNPNNRINLRVILRNKSNSSKIIKDDSIYFNGNRATFNIDGLQPECEYNVQFETPVSNGNKIYAFRRVLGGQSAVSTSAKPSIIRMGVEGTPILSFYSPQSKDSMGIKIKFVTNNYCKVDYEVISQNKAFKSVSTELIIARKDETVNLPLNSDVLPKSITEGGGFNVNVTLTMLDALTNLPMVNPPANMVTKYQFNLGLVIEKPKDGQKSKREKKSSEDIAKDVGKYVGMGLKALVNVFLGL